MLIQRSGAAYAPKTVFCPVENHKRQQQKEIQKVKELTQHREIQRLQNCKTLESELLFLYLQSLPYLDDSPKDKGDLHQVYISLIEARDYCKGARGEIPPYVNDCIDALVEKAFDYKKGASKKSPLQKTDWFKRCETRLLSFFRLN